MDISNKELLAISLKIEREGKLFYQELAKRVKDSKVQEFFQVMSKEEAQHEIQFKKMLEEKGSQSYGWENKKELRDLIDGKFQTDIFPRLDEALINLPQYEGIQKALEFAVEAEKVAAEFYSLMGQDCSNIETKTLLVLLEKAEHDHLLRVESLKEHFLKKSD